MKLAACIVLSLVGQVSAQSLHLLGVAADGDVSRGHGLSPNGEIAVGYSRVGAARLNKAFSWTQQTGRNDWGLLPGMPSQTIAYGVTDSGTMVGEMATPSGTRAFRFNGQGVPESLGSLADRSFARYISRDGSTVVGYCEAGQQVPFSFGFRWTEATGMHTVGPPGLNVPGGVSHDGSTVVGVAMDATFTRTLAYRWTLSGGNEILPDLPGMHSGSSATAMNFDGSIVAGTSGVNQSGVIWRDGQIITLPIPPGIIRLSPEAMNDDGSVVVGGGWIWTPAGGTEILSDYLRNRGVAVPTGMGLSVNAVSADGLTFCGTTTGVGFTSQAFVAHVPAPFSIGLLVAVPFLRRRCNL